MSAPRPAAGARGFRTPRTHVALDIDLITRHAGSPELVTAYAVLMAWEARGEEVSARRYLDECWGGDRDTHRLWPLWTLVALGEFVLPDLPPDPRPGRCDG